MLSNLSLGICRRLKFTTTVDGYALKGHVIKNISFKAAIHLHSHCKNLCIMEDTCVSINIGLLKGRFLCQLSNSDHIKDPGDLENEEGFTYRGREGSNPLNNTMVSKFIPNSDDQIC